MKYERCVLIFELNLNPASNLKGLFKKGLAESRLK
jgi:hypothetical protein